MPDAIPTPGLPPGPEGAPSLRADLRRRLLPPLLLALAVGAGASHRLIQHYTGEEQDRTLRETARALAQEVALGGRTGANPVALLAGAEQLLVWNDEDRTAYRLAGLRGTQIAGQRALPLPPTNAISGPGQTRTYDTALDGEPARAVATLVPGGWHGRPAWLLLAETRHRRDAVGRAVLLAVLLPQALLAMLLIGLVQRAVSKGLAPLEDLAARLEARSDTDFAHLPDTDVPTEARGLTHALNRLLARLDATLTAQRRFVADAAHQLRTPLTALGLNITRLADLLRQPATTAAQRESALASLAASTARAVRLSEQLLSLARAEARAPRAADTPPIDLAATLADALAETALKASDAGVEVALDVPTAPVMVAADPVLLGEAARNLVENALAYARPRAGRPEVVVAVRAAPAAFSVRDNGPGVTPEHRARLFERFFRGDRSDSHGSGLGLAIVADIAHRSGASVGLVAGLAPDGSGFGVQVSWPAATG